MREPVPEPASDDPATFVRRLGATGVRPVEVVDAAGLFPLIHDRPDVTRWLCWSGPSTLAELEDRYGGWRLSAGGGTTYVFAVTDAESDAPIGEATLRFEAGQLVGDLGFWLGAPHHGRGHGTRTVELLARLGFEACGAAVLTASVKEGNGRSLHVLERAGFVRDRAPGAGSEVEGGELPDRIGWILTLTRRAHARRQGRA